MSTSQFRRRGGQIVWIMTILVLAGASFGLALKAPQSVYAASFQVNSQHDGLDASPGDGICATSAGFCTLRAAVQEANALAGADSISLPAGVFTLSIGSEGENAAAGGDLDISSDVTISGAGARQTTIQAGPGPGQGIDRIFDVRPGGAATIVGVTLRNGTTNSGLGFSNNEGAALWNQGTATIRDALITASQASGSGGAIYNYNGALTIERTTISNNSTPGDSGAIQTDAAASGATVRVTIVNSTISGNSAGGTGAMLVTVNGPAAAHLINIYSSTIAGNGPGGISVVNSTINTVNVRNSILAGNAGNECGGQPWTAGAGNLIDDSTCGPDATIGRIGAVTSFNPGLTDNGGPAPTHMLFPGSNAIDAGVDGCQGSNGAPLPVDQRGLGRPQGPACDIGAVEAAQSPQALLDFNDPSFSSQTGTAALSALQDAYAIQGVSFDAYRSFAASPRFNDGALTVDTDPDGADLLLTFPTFAVEMVSFTFTSTGGGTKLAIGRARAVQLAAVTATTIGGSRALEIQSRAGDSSPGQFGVAGSCIRSVQIETTGATYSIDNLTFRRMTGPDGDGDGIVDQCDQLVVTADDGLVTNYTGPGSLHEALAVANLDPGLDRIAFSLPGPGPQLINPTVPLPAIADPVFIDGYSQPGATPNLQTSEWDATVLVELNGNVGFTDPLVFSPGSEGSTVRGLQLTAFSTAVTVGAGNVKVAGNLIGNDGNTQNANGVGVAVTGGSGSLIGGPDPADRNIISGNTTGITLGGPGSAATTVRNNYIGTTASGAELLGNSGSGIVISSPSNVVRDNLISGNVGDGITVDGAGGANTAGTLIVSNIIGLNLAGALPLENFDDGVALISGASGVTIGGTAAADRNIIAGNLNDEVELGAGSDGNTIQGNYIGTNLTGTQDFSSYAFLGAPVGIRIASNGNTIGGLTPGAGNIVSGQQTSAIAIESGNDNTVAGNLIGLGADGTTALPSFQDGVTISGASSGNLIGGLTPGAGNRIAFNQRDGVRVDESTGNSILSNLIYANAGAITLLNGGNNSQAAPTLTTAIPDFPAAGQSNIQGWLLTGTPVATYTVQLFSREGCAPGGAAQADRLLDTLDVTTGPDGTAALSSTLALALAPADFVTATATDGAGNTSALATCLPVGPDNTVWYQAQPLNAGASESVSQPIAASEQVRWYSVEVAPRSRIVVNLGSLPAGYDLALFNDLGARAEALTAAASGDLATTLAVAQTEISYDEVEASNFITNTLAPEQYSPEAYTSLALAPGSFRPDVLADAVVSPFKTSPFKTSPFKTSPFKTSPFKTSPFKTSPFKTSPFKTSDLAGLVVDSGLLSYTDLEGTVPRSLSLFSYAERGRVYIAVYGRNGAFDPVQRFTLTATSTGDECSALTPPTVAGPLASPQSGSYKTIFVTDFGRIPGSEAEKQQLRDLLSTFSARSEVAGLVVDVAQDARVAAAQATAAANPGCPEAKNFIAAEVKRIVDGQRAASPGLRYVVLMGGDEVIPYFRYPDQALLGNESEFSPPVRNDSSAEATLRLGYILGQDEYGSRFALDFRTARLAIPDLPVGRLVETASDATAMINRYIADGGVIIPARSIVSGYDFHYDSTLAISSTIALGTAAPVDALVSPSTDSYQEPGTWTAADLKGLLTTRDYDLLYLAGHFSDGALQAADYATDLRASELEAAATTQLFGALVVSPGCHSGFNTPDGAAIAGATNQPDWAQLFARRGTTLVAGTGYQYGDTQFTQFAEELYARLFEQLRIDAFPGSPAGDEVAIGDALVLAKQRYLIDSAVIRGIDKKTISISTLFGLPMTRVNMQGARLAPQPLPPLPETFGPLVPIGAAGDSYRVQSSQVIVSPDLTVETIDLSALSDGLPRQATYVRGATPADLISRPAEPVLPLAQYRVGRAGQQVRGALFLRGSYTELGDVLPLTGAPATELRGVHMTFPTESYFPEKWWDVNYLGELTGVAGDDRTRLQLTPSQFLAAPGSSRGTLRYYESPLEFRLFYSDQTTADASGFNPALAGTPAIPAVSFARDGDAVRFTVSANGGGVPMREVWVTFTADAGPLNDRWDSIQLTPDSADPTRWEGRLTLPAGTQGFSFFVQGANATGFTALNTNLGLYFQAGGIGTPPPPPPVPPSSESAVATSLSLGLPASPTYGLPATFTAQLAAEGGASVADKPLSLSVGSQTASARTNAGGQASFTLTLYGTGAQTAAVTFGGDSGLRASSASAGLSIGKQQPTLTISPTLATVAQGTPVTLTAALADAEGGIRGARLYLAVAGTSVSASTAPDGRASLALPSLSGGTYPYTVTYLLVPTASGTTPESDARYLPATATGTLTVTSNRPVVTLSPVAQADMSVGTTPNSLVNVTFRGAVSANGFVTTAGFEYRRDGTATYTFVPVTRIIAGNNIAVSATANGLAQGATYFVRMTARNSQGSVTSGEVSFTTPTVGPAGLTVTPLLECVADRGAGTSPRYQARFGYNNPYPYGVRVPIGPSNGFTPAPQNRGQPTVFSPGRVADAFRVTFNSGSQVWTLTGLTATASPTSVRCP